MPSHPRGGGGSVALRHDLAPAGRQWWRARCCRHVGMVRQRCENTELSMEVVLWPAGGCCRAYVHLHLHVHGRDGACCLSRLGIVVAAACTSVCVHGNAIWAIDGAAFRWHLNLQRGSCRLDGLMHEIIYI